MDQIPAKHFVWIGAQSCTLLSIISLPTLSLLLARSHSGVFREKPNWERGGGKRVFFFLPSLLLFLRRSFALHHRAKKRESGAEPERRGLGVFWRAARSQTLTPNTRHAATLLFPVTVLLLYLLLHLSSASRWTDSRRRRSERRGRSRDDPGDVHADHLQGAL